MTKKEIIIPAVAIIVILGFILMRGKSAAPTTGKTTNETAAQSQPAAQPDTQAQAEQPAAQPETNPQPAANNPDSSSSSSSNSNDTNAMGLKIETTQKGTGDRVTKAGDTISVQYTGKLTDGTKFDSSLDHGGAPFTFTLGAGQVIAGWDQGLLGMQVGEKRTLTIPPSLGYGATGAGGVIPPNATLIFDVELVSIQ